MQESIEHTKEQISNKLQELTSHKYIKLTTRGNNAIKAALKLFHSVLIPSEGGWISYQKLPKQLKLTHEQVNCIDSKIDLEDLKNKLNTQNYECFLYQNPSGYFANNNQEEIYNICKEHNCKVILDASGSLGTNMCDGDFADFIIASFGTWKLVEAGGGGFISTNNEQYFNQINQETKDIEEEKLESIKTALNNLPNRIKFLSNLRQDTITKLNQQIPNANIVHKEDKGFVIVIKFNNVIEKENLEHFCKTNNLEYTICPRYIRLNDNAISIELKRKVQ